MRTTDARRETLMALYRGCLLTVAVLVVLVVLAGASTYLIFRAPGSELKVPNLIGQTAQQARAAAEAMGLTARVAGWRYDDSIPAGAVCSTEPGPGRAVRKGRGIRLFVSQGPRNSGVPDLAGQTVAEARDLLAKRSLTVGEVWNGRSSEKVGVVVGQSASPGSKVAAGTPIDLETSGGPDFGVVHIEGAPDRLFRTVVLRLPDDGAQHHVLVKLGKNGEEQVVHDRLHPPKERVEVEVTGETGDRVLVFMDDRNILTRRL
jgi:hypothetical protein